MNLFTIYRVTQRNVMKSFVLSKNTPYFGQELAKLLAKGRQNVA